MLNNDDDCFFYHKMVIFKQRITLIRGSIMKYTIKEISNLLGVTTHKLRYYEKMQIIEPEVNENNGYRYYSVIDTRRFNLARLYRGMGFTVEECCQLLGSISSASIIERINDQREKLQKEIEFKKACVNDMASYTAFLKRIPNFLDQVDEIELEEHIRIEFSDNEIIKKDKTILSFRDELLEYSPLIRWVSRIEKETIAKQTTQVNYHYGINMSLKKAKQLGIKISNYQIVPAGKYLITVFKKNDDPSFGWETLTLIQDYLKEKKITNYGDGYSSCIHSIISDDKYYNYHYLIVKVA